MPADDHRHKSRFTIVMYGSFARDLNSRRAAQELRRLTRALQSWSQSSKTILSVLVPLVRIRGAKDFQSLACLLPTLGPSIGTELTM